MPKKKQTISEVLRQAIIDSGLPHLTIEQKTGVKRASVMRFVNGETSLHLSTADKLAQFFNVEARIRKAG